MKAPPATIVYVLVVVHYLTAVALLGNSFWSEIMKSSKKGLGLEYKATKLHNSNFGHVVVEVSWVQCSGAIRWTMHCQPFPARLDIIL